MDPRRLKLVSSHTISARTLKCSTRSSRTSPTNSMQTRIQNMIVHLEHIASDQPNVFAVLEQWAETFDERQSKEPRFG